MGVVLPIEEYERLIEALEDAEDVRLYDKTKAEIAAGAKPRHLITGLSGSWSARNRRRKALVEPGATSLQSRTAPEGGTGPAKARPADRTQGPGRNSGPR